jgi:alpha-glucosidase
MAWDGSPSGGFSDVAPESLWLPLHPGHKDINVAAELEDRASMLNLYRRLLALRRATPALHGGDYRPLDVEAADVFAFERVDGGDRVLVALNFSDRPQRVALSAGHGGRYLLSTRASRDGERVTDALELGPDEAVVVG